MRYIDETNRKERSYPTYGRQFRAYKWYKPILVGWLFTFFYMFLSVALILGMSIVMGVSTGSPDMTDIFSQLELGYDGMDFSDPIQCILNLGGLALMLPSLWLASLIVRDRPFSSYSSSRGGWSSRVFWRVFPVAFLCISIPILFVELVVYHHYSDFSLKFTLGGFIVLTILGPLQCIAEEYLFRGFIMQTIGSWVRVPVIAVILQSLIFAAGHPYNRIGQVGIFITGLVFAVSAWLGRGLEVPAAMHICNNMTIFYLQGLNMAAISSQAEMSELIFDVATGALYLIFIFALGRKTNWFDKIRKDDLARANEKYARRMARKAARRGEVFLNEDGTVVPVEESRVVFEKVSDGEYEGRRFKK